MLYRSGEHFIDSFAKGMIMNWCKQYGFDVEMQEKALKDVENTFDELSGKNTSDLKTFEMGVFLAFKD